LEEFENVGWDNWITETALSCSNQQLSLLNVLIPLI